MSKVVEFLAPFNKAFMAAVVPVFSVAVGDLADVVSASAAEWVTAVVVAVLTSAGVYRVPNKQV